MEKPQRDPNSEESEKPQKGPNSEEIENIMIHLYTAISRIDRSLNKLIKDYSELDYKELEETTDEVQPNKRSLMAVIHELPAEIRTMISNIVGIEKQIEYLREILL